MSGFSAFVINLSNSGNILFRSVPNETFLFSSASIVIGRRQFHGCMNLEWWHLLSYMQIQHIMPNILHWNQFGKNQSVIGGKLFFFYRAMFQLAQSSRLGYFRKNSNWEEWRYRFSSGIKEIACRISKKDKKKFMFTTRLLPCFFLCGKSLFQNKIGYLHDFHVPYHCYEF